MFVSAGATFYVTFMVEIKVEVLSKNFLIKYWKPSGKISFKNRQCAIFQFDINNVLISLIIELVLKLLLKYPFSKTKITNNRSVFEYGLGSTFHLRYENIYEILTRCNCAQL